MNATAIALDKARRDLRKLERQARDTPKPETAAKCDSLIRSVKRRIAKLEREALAAPPPEPPDKPKAVARGARALTKLEREFIGPLQPDDMPLFLRRSI